MSGIVADAPVEVPDTFPADWDQSRSIERGALWFVNRTREALGRPPVDQIAKGRPGRSDRCPLARSIGPDVRIGNATIHFLDQGRSLPMTHEAVTFVQKFDKGELPQYRESIISSLFRR
jgi:hypothetical protein